MDAEKRWLSIDGPEFIAKIGISAGHAVVDFGCGDGYYTFPAARVVKDQGRAGGFHLPAFNGILELRLSAPGGLLRTRNSSL